MNDKKQTIRQTAALRILYDITNSLNQSYSLDDNLRHFLALLTEMMGAKSATVCLFQEEQMLEMIASTKKDQFCVCSPEDKKHNLPKTTRISIPLTHNGKQLGMYNFLLPETQNTIDQDLQELLESIGRQLGMAIDRSHMEQRMRYLTIAQERKELAFELQDSLSSSFASLILRTEHIATDLDNKSPVTAKSKLTQLQHKLEQTNQELNHLINILNNKPVVRNEKNLINKSNQVEVEFVKNIEHNSYKQRLEPLTPRELEVLDEISKGKSNKAIAYDLSITDATVKLHVKSLLKKLEINSRVEAAIIGVKNGLGNPESL